MFEQLDFQLAQSEDERIAVDNVAKAIDPSAKESTVSTGLVSSVNAVKLLRRKIRFLVDVFQNSEQVSQNPEFARKLSQIVSQLQVLSDQSSQTESHFESSFYSDIAALNMLATATKGFESLQELAKEMQVVSKGSNRRGGHGLFSQNMISNQQMDI